MESIRINSGIKRYLITNENDEEVAVLVLDTKDDRFMDRFLELLEKAKEIRDRVDRELKDLEISDTDKISTRTAKNILEINKQAIADLIKETNKMFGADFLKDIFKEHYEINPNFMPDIEAITDVYAAVMPIIEKAYKEKDRKYSAGYKGQR